jgi:hypothetical protein
MPKVKLAIEKEKNKHKNSLKEIKIIITKKDLLDNFVVQSGINYMDAFNKKQICHFKTCKTSKTKTESIVNDASTHYGTINQDNFTVSNLRNSFSLQSDFKNGNNFNSLLLTYFNTELKNTKNIDNFSPTSMKELPNTI